MSETVVIAGAGPAGLMLACELGLLGVPTVVLDPLPEVSDRSPGQGLNTSCIELLEQRGMLDGLVEQGAPLQGTHFSLFWLDMSPLDGHNQRGLLLGQERLERHLEARARALGVDLRRGHAFVSHAADEAGVTVTVAAPTGGYDVRAAYLVGADGERSAVRTQAGVGFPGHGQPCYGLAGDVEADVAELAEIHVGARFSPAGGLYAAAPSGAGRLRVVTAEFGRDLPADDPPPDLAELMASVERLNGSSFPAWGAHWL
ncbi:MAG: FAD-dependent monooxygenase, partial [Frankia sp.]